MPTAYAIGDIHGHLPTLIHLLTKAGLIDQQRNWSGGAAHLFFMGDFVDRGEDGVGVIAFVMRLQAQAAVAGGSVQSVLGNHDAMLAMAVRFPRGVLNDTWFSAGGVESDRARITPEQLEWLLNLPAMIRWNDLLIMHADARLYSEYGNKVAEVNAAIRDLMHNGTPRTLDRFTEQFSEHRAFWVKTDRAANFLVRYGGERLLHGHTPIPVLQGGAPPTVKEALVYAHGRCINLDGGIYLGGSGFVHVLE
jgi:Calcineurin-like phosphoesterase